MFITNVYMAVVEVEMKAKSLYCAWSGPLLNHVGNFLLILQYIFCRWHKNIVHLANLIIEFFLNQAEYIFG